MACLCLIASLLAYVSPPTAPQEVDRVPAYLQFVEQFNRVSAAKISEALAAWEPGAARQAVESLVRSDRVTPRAVLMEVYVALWSLRHGRPEIGELHLELAITLSQDPKRAQRDRA